MEVRNKLTHQAFSGRRTDERNDVRTVNLREKRRTDGELTFGVRPTNSKDQRGRRRSPPWWNNCWVEKGNRKVQICREIKVVEFCPF